MVCQGLKLWHLLGNYSLTDLMNKREAEIDMASFDPHWLGSCRATESAVKKNEEAYDHVFALHHGDEERFAARTLRTSAAYDRQTACGRSSAR